jgi:hypothetical protein
MTQRTHKCDSYGILRSLLTRDKCSFWRQPHNKIFPSVNFVFRNRSRRYAGVSESNLLAFYWKLCNISFVSIMVVDINLKILADDIKHDPDSIMQKPIACSLCKSENVITD